LTWRQDAQDGRIHDNKVLDVRFSWTTGSSSPIMLEPRQHYSRALQGDGAFLFQARRPARIGALADIHPTLQIYGWEARQWHWPRHRLDRSAQICVWTFTDWL